MQINLEPLFGEVWRDWLLTLQVGVWGLPPQMKIATVGATIGGVWGERPEIAVAD